MGFSEPDADWRTNMMAQVHGGSLGSATDALLSLTNCEPDRRWLEGQLIDVIDGPLDLQVRQLAVICLGHLARIHGAISPHVREKLTSLESSPDFRSRARNALEDVEIFVK
ncbi:hypothetical protein [Staphylococcus capitis]|uniref:hypothetical protein n=1 Tax=Staphylococcus capitis TaxID=29388 RepID=UPI003D0725A6